MLGNNNAGLDNRFAQFAGQGQPGGGTGFPGLGGNMQALQSLQAGGFGLQNPLQGGRWVAWRGGGGGGGSLMQAAVVHRREHAPAVVGAGFRRRL